MDVKNSVVELVFVMYCLCLLCTSQLVDGDKIQGTTTHNNRAQRNAANVVREDSLEKELKSLKQNVNGLNNTKTTLIDSSKSTDNTIKETPNLATVLQTRNKNKQPVISKIYRNSDKTNTVVVNSVENQTDIVLVRSVTSLVHSIKNQTVSAGHSITNQTDSAGHSITKQTDGAGGHSIQNETDSLDKFNKTHETTDGRDSYGNEDRMSLLKLFNHIFHRKSTGPREERIHDLLIAATNGSDDLRAGLFSNRTNKTNTDEHIKSEVKYLRKTSKTDRKETSETSNLTSHHEESSESFYGYFEIGKRIRQRAKDAAWASISMVFIVGGLICAILYTRMWRNRHHDWINSQDPLPPVKISLRDVILSRAKYLPRFNRVSFHKRAKYRTLYPMDDGDEIVFMDTRFNDDEILDRTHRDRTSSL